MQSEAVNAGSGVATVTVKGEAAISAEPDEAILWITLSAFEESPGRALADVAKRSEALVALLDELEVIEAHRSTAGVSVQEEFDPPTRGGRGVGHRATARVAIRLADPEVIGRAISRTSEELRASIDGPHWYVSLVNPIRFEAAKQAVIDAKRKAQACAEGADAKLGALIKLSEPDTGARPPRGVRRAATSDTHDMPIEIEQLEVHAEVEITFELVELVELAQTHQ